MKAIFIIIWLSIVSFIVFTTGYSESNTLRSVDTTFVFLGAVFGSIVGLLGDTVDTTKMTVKPEALVPISGAQWIFIGVRVTLGLFAAAVLIFAAPKVVSVGGLGAVFIAAGVGFSVDTIKKLAAKSVG
ncbi:hypothetical protein [Cupriavidus pauculus]|uniref:hypothetical protein n=1 Tax=Cupriavidus pauculus TaxID=82633 RepID=UPI0011AF6482|nr:hypothetical protein [Cupriavidus pauculus]